MKNRIWYIKNDGFDELITIMDVFLGLRSFSSTFGRSFGPGLAGPNRHYI